MPKKYKAPLRRPMWAIQGIYFMSPPKQIGFRWSSSPFTAPGEVLQMLAEKGGVTGTVTPLEYAECRSTRSFQTLLEQIQRFLEAGHRFDLDTHPLQNFCKI